jgi:hypothetical protein
MTEPRDSDSEMPTSPFPWATRPEARAGDALLAGTCQPEEAPAELRAVAEVFAALRAPADQREVAGWDHALTAYRGVAGLPEASSRSRRRRPRLIAAPLGTKLAAAAGVAVVALLSGGVAAAYTGNLPVALQKVAHDTIAAPGVRVTRTLPTPSGPVHPVGPPATGSAAHGLCRAYQQSEGNGKSVAYRNLVKAAGGAGQVAAYCAGIGHPGPVRPSASSSASQPGRRVGQSGSPGHTRHHPQNHPTTGTPTPTTAPGKGKKEHGGGNGHGKQSP